MPSSSGDENLLFGLLALQLDFVDRDELLAAMNSWMVEKSKPLGVLLKERQYLDEDEYRLLSALVQKHLERHGEDASKSLASLSSLGPARAELEKIADFDMQQSLAIVSRDHAIQDPDSTWTFSGNVVTPKGARFRILRPHAAGALGEVSVAIDEELNREVALKELKRDRAHDQNSRARFLQEAEITGRLEHPGIVPVYGMGQYDDGRPFYAMRFVQGDNLKEAIDRFHRSATAGAHSLEFRKLLGRFVDVCQAVHFAHCRGVLHRDLKPGNVMLGKYGEALVGDWGLAKAVGRADCFAAEGEITLEPRSGSNSAATQVGSVIGTPSFMSPEQAEGRLDQLGPASDIYSLGATLYYLLTGHAPFLGHDLGQILTKVRKGDFRRPRQIEKRVDRSLEAICLKAMANEPSKRYKSAVELALDIERWLADDPVQAYQESIRERLSRSSRRLGVTVRAFVAAIILIIASFITFVTVNLRETWNSKEQDLMRLTASQAELALAFDVAIRDYVAESIRPAMAKRIPPDEFVVEAMSTSYIARSVFEKVSLRFDDYFIKFSSDNPRNPKNRADQEELAILAYFREHPRENYWKGMLRLRAKGTDQLQEYYVCSRAMRITQDCLKCHGKPEDSPKALLALYGPQGGFGRQDGDLAGMDLIGIPMSRVQAALWQDAGRNIGLLVTWSVALLAAIGVALRLIIPRRRFGRAG